MKSVLLTSLLVLLTSGCSSGPETAQDTFKQYLRHVFLNQDEQAWELIVPEDRDELVTLKQKLKSAGTSYELEAHETLLVRAIVNPYAIKSVMMLDAVKDQAADEATIEYELVDGRKGIARMKRVQEQWYIKILP
jgi:hypothetical protein